LAEAEAQKTKILKELDSTSDYILALEEKSIKPIKLLLSLKITERLRG
jgi:hypothetical protein